LETRKQEALLSCLCSFRRKKEEDEEEKCDEGRPNFDSVVSPVIYFSRKKKKKKKKQEQMQPVGFCEMNH